MNNYKYMASACRRIVVFLCHVIVEPQNIIFFYLIIKQFANKVCMECLQNKIMFTINTQSNKNLRQTDIHTQTDRYLGINRGFTGVRIVKKH